MTTLPYTTQNGKKGSPGEALFTVSDSRTNPTGKEDTF